MKRIAALLCLCTLAPAGDLWVQLSEEAGAAVAAADGALVHDRYGASTYRFSADEQGRWLRFLPVDGAAIGVRVVAIRPLVVFTRESGNPRPTREVSWRDGTTRKLKWIDGDDLLGVDVYEVEGELPACDRKLDFDARPLRRGELVLALGEHRYELVGLTRTEPVAAPFDLDVRDDVRALLGPGGSLRALRSRGEAAAPSVPTLRLHPPDLAYMWDSTRLLIPDAGSASPRFIPAAAILRAVRDVDTHGKIRTPWLGVVLGDHSDGAVIVTSVIAGSPAGKARLQRGDRIAAIDGFRVANADEATRIIRMQEPGSRVELTLAEPERKVSVVLGDATEGTPRVVRPEDVGLHGIELDPAFLDYLGVAQGTAGVLVKAVDEGSAAEAAGLRKGDVIVRASTGAIAGLDALRAAFAEAPGALTVWWVRGQEHHEGTLVLPPARSR